MPATTDFDAMRTDPRCAAGMDDFIARVRAGRPVRWHVLTFDVLGTQAFASWDLASVTDLKWRLAQGGIATTLTSQWVTFPRPGGPDVP
jgi:hypothetical protein